MCAHREDTFSQGFAKINTFFKNYCIVSEVVYLLNPRREIDAR